MGVYLIISGIVVVVISTFLIIRNNKKMQFKRALINEQELKLREFKNSIDDLQDEFNKTADLKIKLIKDKERDIKALAKIVDTKLSEGNSLLKILENSYKKVTDVEISKNKVGNLQNGELTKGEILDYYAKGYNVKQISAETGKSLVEIQKIMGIK